MRYDRLINRPCTVIHRSDSGVKDRRGNPIWDEDEEATVCELQQTMPSENPEGVAKGEYQIFFLPGQPIAQGDAVIIPGEGRFEIEGLPNATRSPRRQAMGQVETYACKTAGEVEGSGGS